VILAFVAIFLGPLAIPLLLVLVLAGVLTFVLLTAAIRMPLVVYVRYYALLVLGATEPELDLIPDRRDAARSDTEWEGWDDGDDWAGPRSRDSSDSEWGDTDSNRPDDRGGGWDTTDDEGERDDDSWHSDDRGRDGGWGYRDEDDGDRDG